MFNIDVLRISLFHRKVYSYNSICFRSAQIWGMPELNYTFKLLPTLSSPTQQYTVILSSKSPGLNRKIFTCTDNFLYSPTIQPTKAGKEECSDVKIIFPFRGSQVKYPWILVKSPERPEMPDFQFHPACRQIKHARLQLIC